MEEAKAKQKRKARLDLVLNSHATRGKMHQHECNTLHVGCVSHLQVLFYHAATELEIHRGDVSS